MEYTLSASPLPSPDLSPSHDLSVRRNIVALSHHVVFGEAYSVFCHPQADFALERFANRYSTFLMFCVIKFCLRGDCLLCKLLSCFLLRDCTVWHSHGYQPSRISVANQTQEGRFILLHSGHVYHNLSEYRNWVRMGGGIDWKT